MTLSAKIFAHVGGDVITQYTLQNPSGMTIRFLTFGARVQQVRLPSAGMDPNLLLGFITLQDYLTQPGAFGALVGPDCHHPNRAGWANWNWRATTAEGPRFDRLTLRLALGPDQDGAPGARTITVVHTLSADNLWTTTTTVETTHPVPVRLAYQLAWQLTGDPAQTILAEALTVQGAPHQLPTTATTLAANRLTLADQHWALTYSTDAPQLRLDPLADVGEANNFNGILGQPHVGLIIQPLPAGAEPLLVTPGAPLTVTTQVRLTAK